MPRNTLTHTLLLLCTLLLPACEREQKPKHKTEELQAYEQFFHEKGDSLSFAPRRMRTEALQRMRQCTDSLARYNYLSFASKTCLIASDTDSAQLLVSQIEAFAARQPFSTALADLQAECANMQGNIHARLGNAEEAVKSFHWAYEQSLKGTRMKYVPDILINLADANNRMGRLDAGASWYRRALLLCDSLGLVSTQKTPIYYGLAQVYVALRDFEKCDQYYDYAARSFDTMLPFEKHFYLNNRGTSYYFRGEYETALRYFEQVVDLVRNHPDMTFELNLSWLNMADCLLQMGKPDRAAEYLGKCEPFFRKMGVSSALYYIDTQRIELALQKKELDKARRLLTQSTAPPGIDPDLIHIRNKYLQQYYEKTGDYRNAYIYQKESIRLNDSLRSERMRMRTADLALRYQQDSTLMSQQVLIQEAENELLHLQQARALWIAIFTLTALTATFYYIYSKKRRELMEAENRRTVSTLRLENIRNRLSPHFIFNVLNQQIANSGGEERRELSALVKLMRRNLEMAEQICVTLAEELDFVKTYLELERPTLEPDFELSIKIDPDIDPDKVLLPAMLIQIPAENGVKHALRGKEGKKMLAIQAERREKGIVLSITDNGGGFKTESRNQGTKSGMKMIMQTIQTLNSKNKEAIDVNIKNVTMPGGETGCQVTFRLPERYNYLI